MKPLLALAVLFAVGGSATAAPSRVVDRTMTCRVAGMGYPDPSRYVTVDANPRVGARSPYVSLTNDRSLAKGNIGRGAILANVVTGPYYGRPTGVLAMARARCARVVARVPFATSGLRRRKTEQGARWSCEVPATVLVRVHAVFRRPVTLGVVPQSRELLIAQGRMKTASVAVATRSRGPIIFASIDDATGKAALFTSPARCEPS